MAAAPMPCPDALADARFLGRSRDGLYEPVLADIEREAVADLLQYLENVRHPVPGRLIVGLRSDWTDTCVRGRK